MKILAVDDDPIVLEILRQFISASGDHILDTMTSPTQALELLQADQTAQYDCYFLDIQMPVMDGIELTSQIRKLAHLRSVPIVMLTAMSDKAYIDAAFSAGATDYMTKPFDASDLRGRLALLELVAPKTPKPSAGKTVAEQPLAFNDPIALSDPVPIFEVDHVIEHTAMENYLLQLSRGAIFGSSAFGLAIRDVENMHASLSPFEFHSMVSDVAEVISDTLAPNQFHMTYSGNGVFICVADRSWTPVTEKLMDKVNLRLAQTEIYNNTGAQLYIRVSAGEAFRFVWKSGQGVLDTIGKAYDSADQASKKFVERKNDFWLNEKIA